jgi:hypothetical protein
MKRPTLFLGGSLHGKRLSVAGEPDRYDYRLPESRGIRTMINGCQGFDPKRKPLAETYNRVENEAVGVVYVLEGYEPTREEHDWVSSHS